MNTGRTVCIFHTANHFRFLNPIHGNNYEYNVTPILGPAQFIKQATPSSAKVVPKEPCSNLMDVDTPTTLEDAEAEEVAPEDSDVQHNVLTQFATLTQAY